MTSRVLSVGQCVPDNSTLSRFLKANFDVEFVTADDGVNALDAMLKSPFDLVLVNRKLDCDYTDGTEVLRLLKSDPRTESVPVMLVTNYPEHQDAAVAMGAVHGIGKSGLNSDAVAKLSPYLAKA